MPTNYTDQFFFIDPYSPPAAGTTLNFSVFTMVDADDDNDVGTDGGDTINGSDVTGTYNGDTVTVTLPGGGTQTIVGVTFYLANGQRVFTPSDGSVLENGSVLVSTTWVSPNTQIDVTTLGPACFTPGTMIETPKGARPIEDLQEGDIVHTADAGLQRVRMVCRRVCDASGPYAPIRIAKGVIGNRRDLLVSPQHRVQLTGWVAELYFGEDEVLIAAKHLVNVLKGVTVEYGRTVEYIHVILDGHHLLITEGAVTESFDIGGDFAFYDPIIRREFEGRYPGRIEQYWRNCPTVLPVVRGHEVMALAS